MGNLLYLIAAILILLWAIGFIVFALSNVIHVLLIIAFFAIVLRIVEGKEKKK